MNDRVKGYFCGTVAAASYGMNPLFALPLYADGMQADSVLFFRYLLALPMLAWMIVVRGHDFRLRGRDVATLAVLGLLLAFSSLALFLSFTYMEAGIASTLLFVYPILVALIMAVCFGERLTGRTVACIALAFCGIVLLYRGGGTAALSLAGVLLVLGSSLAYAIYMVWVNLPSLREIPTVKLTFYVLLFGWSLFAVRLPAAGGLQLPSDPLHWLCVAALALLPTCVSFVATTRAIQYIGSTSTAVLGALEPLTAIFFGVTLFGERLTLRSAGGIVLILTAVTLIVAGGRLTVFLLRIRKLFPRIVHRRR